MKRWYVVHTHPHQEARALAHLQRQGYEVYLPRYLRTRRHARRVERVAAALFPRYLFVIMDIAETRWRSVNATTGVLGLVMIGDVPAAIPDRVVEEIRQRETAGYVRIDVGSSLRRGQRVLVNMPSLYDCEAIFDCATDNDRILVLLRMLGRQIRVEVPSHAVAAA